jgi:hypothetical protein
VKTRPGKVTILAAIVVALTTLFACGDSFQEIQVLNQTGKIIHINYAAQSNTIPTEWPTVGSFVSERPWSISSLNDGETKELVAWHVGDEQARREIHKFVLIDSETNIVIDILYFTYSQLADAKWTITVG